VAKYDSNGDLYLLYSATDDGSNVCKLYMKKSDDWTKSWKVSPNEITGYQPLDIFPRTDATPIVCARSFFSIHCFDTSEVTRTSD
jgi:hypothetical protein